MNAPFERIGPATPRWPVILSVPHAGRAYPAGLADDCRFPAHRLLTLEDRHADLLAEEAWRQGFTGLVAHTPRAMIDLNRAEQDMDPGMLTAPLPRPALLSAKARGGLGLVPRRTAGLGELWRRRFSPDEIEARIEQHHRPYHTALSALLEAAHRHFGAALLLDIHSMPPLPHDSLGGPPQIVIGDRFGRTAASHLSEIAGSAAAATGLRIAFNAPYAGGHILDRHAVPARGIHALQIEIDRRLYLDRDLAHPAPGVQAMAQLVAQIAEALSQTLRGTALPIAAE
jgi:N-formylglutamate amidohydrolase